MTREEFEARWREAAESWTRQNVAGLKEAEKVSDYYSYEAFLTGSQFMTHGTDGCSECETGRVTLYVRRTICIECENRARAMEGV